MDIQLKRGLLELCVLTVIRDKPSYGYRIIRDLKSVTEISESTLYPILRRLESAECLTVSAAEYNGRLRKYYRITPQGLARLDDFRAEWAELSHIGAFILREGGTDDTEGI